MGEEKKVARPNTGLTRVSDERHSKYGNFPKWLESDGRRYTITGMDPNGKLMYTDVTGTTMSINPIKDFRKVIEEGIENGVFSGNASTDSNPYGTVLRCELIFQLWVQEGSSTDIELPADLEDEVQALAGAETYYRPALRWLYSQGRQFITGLYSFRDLEGPVTWFEYAYIVFFVLQKSSQLNPAEAKPSKDVSVSVIYNNIRGKKITDIRLTSYKQTNWMKSYLEDIKRGKRYLAYPAYLAFRMGIEAGLVPGAAGMVTDVDSGELRFGSPNVDTTKDDWFLLEVSRKDMEDTLEKVKAL